MANEVAVRSGYKLLFEQLAQHRPHLDHIYDALFVDDCGPRPKSIIEISGEENTGKSYLLHELMARALLPSYFGGKYCSVILIDLDHKFSVPHFLHKLQNIIRESGENCSAEEYEEIALKCLDTAIMLDCYSAESFHLAFDEIEDILLQNQNVALLLIDNIGAYYWMESQVRSLRTADHYADRMTKLRRLCDTHNICCIYTVNSRYIDKTTQSTSTAAQRPAQVNYKFKLHLNENGARHLNERPIVISHTGMQFTTRTGLAM